MVDAASFPGPIGNPVTIATGRYAAILGATPSKGARSPTLWNAAFKAAGIDAVMHPMDVTAGDLPAVVAALKADPRFVGGAIAVPHKQAMLALVGRVEPEAARIGAVNALYRDGGDLVGANTDGAASLAQIVELVGGRHALQTRRVLMEHPIATSNWLVEKTGLTPATVNKSLANLGQLAIVRELTAQKRNRLFSYHGYLEIMNRGTELPER